MALGFSLFYNYVYCVLICMIGNLHMDVGEVRKKVYYYIIIITIIIIISLHSLNAA